jgi:hypothetical protein
MNLPLYQHINLNSASLEELENLLRTDLNLRHPVALNLKALDLDQQREVIGLIENYFVSNNLSYKFPYPIYLITDHERTISKVPVVQETSDLPKFFSQRESKMNVKETHLAGRNKLLQQVVKNSDASASSVYIENYAESHRVIYEHELERNFYHSIIENLKKLSNDG